MLMLLDVLCLQQYQVLLPLQSLLYSCVTIYSTYVRTHCSRYVVAGGTVAAVQLYSGTVAMASLYSYVPVHTA